MIDKNVIDKNVEDITEDITIRLFGPGVMVVKKAKVMRLNNRGSFMVIQCLALN